MRLAGAMLVALVATAALSACGSDPAPGAATVEEERALDEAAEMLEERRLPPEAFKTPDATVTTPAKP
jgi:hypothetical protein